MRFRKSKTKRMSDLTDLLKNIPLGKLNRYAFERFGIKVDGDYRTLETIKQAVQKVFSNDLDALGDGPFNAICLYSEVDPTGRIPGVGKYSGVKSEPIIRVIARIPELHAMIPIPEITDPEKLKLEENTNDRVLFSLHTEFYARFGDGVEQPSPGDFIEVDFDDRKNKVIGRYIRIVSRSSKNVKSEKSPATATFANSQAVPQSEI